MANVITLEEMQQSVLTTRIIGISPFIQHKWSEKAVQMMRDKHAGVRVKNREIRDPEQEFRDAAYVCEDGRFGFPAGGIKACLIGAAHKDIGLEKTLLRKSLFILPDDPINNLIALGNIEAPAVGPQYKRFLSSKKERKQEKERKQKIKDEGYEGAGFLPMDFKEGGRSKLI